MNHDPQAEFKFAYDYALKLLSMRDYSRHKLKKKFKEKEVSPEISDSVLDRLQEQNYLNDDRYASLRIKNFMNRGYSKEQIIFKLKVEGLNPGKEFINNIFEDSNISEIEQIQQLLHKKIRHKTLPTDRIEKKKFQDKLLRYLISKGHQFEAAIQAINSIKSE